MQSYVCTNVIGPLFSLLLMLDIAHDPAVRAVLWELLEETHYGFAAREEAVFIVRGDDGRLSFVRWSGGMPHQAKWTGAIPHGTIAIAHTHPNSYPRPSLTDARTASRTGLPVYVVTRTRIMRTSGSVEQTVMRGEWWRQR